MPKSHQSPATESAFYCGPEYHLASLPAVCSLIYPLAIRLSGKVKDSLSTAGSSSEPQNPPTKTAVFAASSRSIAEHFGRSSDHVLRGYAALERAGWFIRTGGSDGDAVQYTPLLHKEWAKAHPGECCTKVQNFWTGDGDELAPLLYGASGNRVKFFANEIRCLRKTGLPTHEIVEIWRAYWATHGKKSGALQWKRNRLGVKRRFLAMMKEKYCSAEN